MMTEDERLKLEAAELKVASLQWEVDFYKDVVRKMRTTVEWWQKFSVDQMTANLDIVSKVIEGKR